MLTEESIIRDIARLFVWHPVRGAASYLPLSGSLKTFSLMGKVHYMFSRGKRGVVACNMGAALGRMNQSSFWSNVRQYFETHYISQLLIFLFPKLNKDNIREIHSFIGMERLDRELARGKGCILLHAHFGPIHLPLFHLGTAGYDVKQLGYLRKPQGLSRIGEKVSFRLREKCERMIPAEIIQANRFLGSVFRHLKNNGVLMMTGDGTGGGEFVGNFKPFPFMGLTMLFPVGVAKIAGKTGASILPMFTIKEKGKFRYRTIIEAPILSGTADVLGEREVAERFVGLLESYVKEHPYHWHLWDEFEKGKLLV